jgi:hypothetical protein
MSKIALSFSSIVLLTLASVQASNATTYKTGNNNFSLTYNNETEVVNTTLKPSFLQKNPNMDSFWLVATPNDVPQKGVKLIGDLKNNIITAYTYTAGSKINHGEVVSDTIFDNGVINDPTAPWNTIPTGQNITDGWTVLSGDVNLKDAFKSIGVGHGVNKTSGKHIDLDGQTQGIIGKTLATEAGKTYTLTFEHTASPIDDSAYNKNWLPNKPLTLKVDDKEFEFTSKFIESGTWKRETVTFTATSDETDISFISGNTGLPGHVRTGSYLDDITISKNTNNGERLATIYGAIRPNGDGFSFDLTEINKKIVAKGGEKFEIDDTAGIWFKAGEDSDFVYKGKNLVRYTPDISNIGDYRGVNTTIVTPVSEPIGLLTTLAAMTLLFVKKRNKNKK